MPSNAAGIYMTKLQQADALRIAGTRTRNRNVKQVYYSAFLAMVVASWEAYLEGVVEEFLQYTQIQSPPSGIVSLLGVIVDQTIDDRKKKFNTPNFNAARTFLNSCTGYDPINDWHWTRRGWGWQQVQSRVNEIF